MKTFVKVDNKNLKEIVDFYYSTVMQMAKTGPQFAKILQEIPEIEKKFYSYVQNEISSKKGESVEIDYNLRLSSNQKFIKKAFLPAVLGPALSAIGGEAMKEILAGGLGKDSDGILSKFEGVFSKFSGLQKIFDVLKKLTKGAIQEIQDLDLLKSWLILDKTFYVEQANMQFQPLHKKPKYDGKDTTATSKNKFIKVSQTQDPVVNQQVAEEVQKLFPRWKFDDLINEIKTVSANTQIDDIGKQEQFRQVIAKYEKSIQPLHKYIQDLTKQK
jgi:hypothetical protein